MAELVENESENACGSATRGLPLNMASTFSTAVGNAKPSGSAAIPQPLSICETSFTEPGIVRFPISESRGISANQHDMLEVPSTMDRVSTAFT